MGAWHVYLRLATLLPHRQPLPHPIPIVLFLVVCYRHCMLRPSFNLFYKYNTFLPLAFRPFFMCFARIRIKFYYLFKCMQPQQQKKFSLVFLLLCHLLVQSTAEKHKYTNTYTRRRTHQANTCGQRELAKKEESSHTENSDI